MLVPPLRYACVDGRIYRGGYPLPENAPFLRRLRLRTIVSVTPEPLLNRPLEGLDGVQYIHVPSGGEKALSKKKRGVPIGRQTVEAALAMAMDPDRQPVYVHCLNGQQVTSLVVATLRLRQGWALSSVLEEVGRYGDYDREDVAFLAADSANQSSS